MTAPDEERQQKRRRFNQQLKTVSDARFEGVVTGCGDIASKTGRKSKWSCIVSR